MKGWRGLSYRRRKLNIGKHLSIFSCYSFLIILYLNLAQFILKSSIVIWICLGSTKQWDRLGSQWHRLQLLKTLHLTRTQSRWLAMILARWLCPSVAGISTLTWKFGLQHTSAKQLTGKLLKNGWTWVRCLLKLIYNFFVKFETLVSKNSQFFHRPFNSTFISRSAELLDCDIPKLDQLRQYPGVFDVCEVQRDSVEVPIFLVRDDGVIYSTCMTFTYLNVQTK